MNIINIAQRLRTLESRLNSIMEGGKLRQQGDGANRLGVVQIHPHTGTGTGGTISGGGGASPFVARAPAQSISGAATTIAATLGEPVSAVVPNGDYTLTNTPTITAGTQDGQLIIIINEDTTNSITLQDEDTLSGSTLQMGAATRTIPPLGSISFIWSTFLSEWTEQYFNPLVAESPALHVTTITTSTTLTTLQTVVLCNAASGAITVTLPAASGNDGRHYHVKKIDSSGNAITIDGNGSETIDGETTQVITLQYNSLNLVCDGSGWHIL